MDPVAAAASTSTPSSGDASTTPTTSDATKKTFAQLFASAEKDLKTGESLKKVTGHEFARIKGGTRNDMYLNLSGNTRSGKAFDLITRSGHTFHAYGTGKDRVVVEIAAKPSTGGTAATPSS